MSSCLCGTLLWLFGNYVLQGLPIEVTIRNKRYTEKLLNFIQLKMCMILDLISFCINKNLFVLFSLCHYYYFCLFTVVFFIYISLIPQLLSGMNDSVDLLLKNIAVDLITVSV